MYTKTTFKNGLRVITVPSKNTKAVTILVVVATGSKYETKKLNGLSHFLEHMFFKGTKRRPNTLEIAETLDRVGGVYNAFTSKEFTGYFAKVAKEHLDLALDWVSDIFLHSKIESKEIQKEKGVIQEEINMYLDTPMRHIADLWEKLLYGDQPAGWATIGKKQNILQFQRKHLVDYLKSHYSALNTIVCVAGNFSQREILNKIEGCFKPINKKSPKQKIKVTEAQSQPGALLYFKKTDQTHLCLGTRAYDMFHPKRYAQEILATILGGNMSSRLFIQVRERKGLAYYIHTASEVYTDSGYLCTQAGIPHREVAMVVNLILKEYKDIKKKGVSQKELKKAKDYLKGILILSLESSDAQASFYAGQELLSGKILTAKERCVKIDKITALDVKRVAQDIFKPEKLNLALIGPHKSKQGLPKLLKL